MPATLHYVHTKQHCVLTALCFSGVLTHHAGKAQSGMPETLHYVPPTSWPPKEPAHEVRLRGGGTGVGRITLICCTARKSCSRCKGF